MQTFIVTTSTDIVDANDGVLSLREAIEAANNFVGADVIQFSNDLSGQTITLTNGELTITDSVNIQGLGADGLSISGNNASRVFNINDGNVNNQIQVAIDGLTIKEGNAIDVGGGILNTENLSVTNSNITGNTRSVEC